MSVKILVNGQMKVVADVISPGVVAKIGAISFVYSGSDWLQCDGSAISRTTYSDLFAAIGTTFGSGDDVNTFNIPTQAQANRVTFNVITDQTFAQFTSDADIIVNNTSAAYIDISNGAAGPGIRISIIEQSNQGVIIYTDAGHTQSCFMKTGILTLEWNGTSWACIAAHGILTTLITASRTWKAPFTGYFWVKGIGGGGGGGGTASKGDRLGNGGGGGSAAVASRRYFLIQGVSLTITIGSGGSGGSAAPGNAGGSTTVSDGTTMLSCYGGSGGGEGYYDSDDSESVQGYGGSPRGLDGGDHVEAFGISHGGGGGSGGGSGGGGGSSEYGAGGAGASSPGNGGAAPSTAYGAGGGGACMAMMTNHTGGSGTAGCVVIDPLA